jgi:hypothetical protein
MPQIRGLCWFHCTLNSGLFGCIINARIIIEIMYELKGFFIYIGCGRNSVCFKNGIMFCKSKVTVVFDTYYSTLVFVKCILYMTPILLNALVHPS